MGPDDYDRRHRGHVNRPNGGKRAQRESYTEGPRPGGTKETTSNQLGAYRFDLLLPGKYSITVSASSFQTATRDVEVAVGQISGAAFQLTLGAASQTVEVTEQAPLLQTEGGNLSSSINESQAANIPNPGNDLTYMAQIAAGSVMNTGGGGLGNFSSYGISAVANQFTINGMDDNDPFLNLNNSGAKTVSPPTTVFGSVLGADASPWLIQLKLQLNF